MTALGVTALEASLEVAGVKGKITASLPADAATLELDSDFEGLSLTGFSALADYIGTTDPFAALPGPVEQAISDVGGAFSLVHLGLAFDIKGLRFARVDLGVRIDLQGFQIFGELPVLKIKEIDLTLRVETLLSPARVIFGASAKIGIGPDCEMLL